MIPNNIPTILAVFGATGDLMQKKIVPAIFHLYERKKLPTMFKAVGFSKDDISEEEFMVMVGDMLRKHLGKNDFLPESDFLKLFSYHKVIFENLADYKSLDKYLNSIDDHWRVCANKLFYLAVPPRYFEAILKNLSASKLTKPCSPEEGWTRVIIEKPFGNDSKTAMSLESLLSRLFREIQIYRIDHYLAKEIFQNILAFRFSNNLFEQSWNKNFIEKAEIRLLEKSGAEDRGSFYDGLGALRDVGQNHILQILAAITMSNPADFSAEAIRSKRKEVLGTLIAPSGREIKDFSFRAQYDGYRGIADVAKDSATETYFKIRAFLSLPNWQGVPIILESGKRLKEQLKEVVITFKHPTPCLCPLNKERHYKNKIIIRFKPNEEIVLQMWVKKPGLIFELEKHSLSFSLREKSEEKHYTEEYEKLLLDCIAGDQTLFVSSEEVNSMWNFIDPFVTGWKKNFVPLRGYKPDTDEPLAASDYINKPSIGIVELKKEIGIIGLGKMGGNMARRLIGRGWKVYGYDAKGGLGGVASLKELAGKFSSPRIIWLMLPPGKPIEEILFGKDSLVQYLKKGDIIIDGGNSFYKDSIRRFGKLKKMGINFVDAGVSGGPEGALYGSSIMAGGEKSMFQKLEILFYDLAKENGYQFFEGAGAGHFVKMIHNGIEYGMMQAIAEGFTILKKSKYRLNLTKAADIYNQGSVIESRLMGWLKEALILRGEDFKGVSGSVAHTGEGEWTVKTAKELRVSDRIIESALKFRIQSENNPDYTGKILSALREQFGGHS
ncbi:MAG: glucose-6-phosphate dehydrogenase, partial [Candidatus Nealsonbacteria bacterium]|nr:glucose-6-phosphate dehydrogenase [Candidatus Nealsonbacteria bacterium]